MKGAAARVENVVYMMVQSMGMTRSNKIDQNAYKTDQNAYKTNQNASKTNQNEYKTTENA